MTNVREVAVKEAAQFPVLYATSRIDPNQTNRLDVHCSISL